MTVARPRLSIIVPSFNQGRFLPQTLDSIFSQSHPAQEVWVIDGASRDDTVEVLRRYAERHSALQWLSEPDAGPADAVNKGLQRASGDVVGVQSSDDIYYPGAFEAVAQAFEKDSALGLLYGDTDVLDIATQVLHKPRLPPFDHETLFCLRLSIPQSSAFFRRSAAAPLGGWDGAYFGCDIEFWLRLSFRTRVRKLDQVLSGWRQHPGQRTSPNRKAWNDYWRMIDQSPDLRLAPARVRRAARASRHILALYLHPTGNPWALRWHTLWALLEYPRFVRYVPRHRFYPLVPGHRLLRRFARWVRRA